jgi:hypothetical protein
MYVYILVCMPNVYTYEHVVVRICTSYLFGLGFPPAS